MKINSVTIFLLLLLGHANINAQQTIVGSGANASGTGGTVSYSIGQVVYTTATGTTGTLTQGVQQPYEISVTLSLEEASKINLKFSAFPNPTSGFLTLDVDDYNLETLSFLILDVNGKQILNQKVSQKETIISLEKFPSALYFVNILDQNKAIKTFKIIKN